MFIQKRENGRACSGLIKEEEVKVLQEEMKMKEKERKKEKVCVFANAGLR